VERYQPVVEAPETITPAAHEAKPGVSVRGQGSKLSGALLVGGCGPQSKNFVRLLFPSSEAAGRDVRLEP
jgi:hypothetical protein